LRPKSLPPRQARGLSMSTSAPWKPPLVPAAASAAWARRDSMASSFPGNPQSTKCRWNRFSESCRRREPNETFRVRNLRHIVDPDRARILLSKRKRIGSPATAAPPMMNRAGGKLRERSCSYSTRKLHGSRSAGRTMHSQRAGRCSSAQWVTLPSAKEPSGARATNVSRPVHATFILSRYSQ